MVILAREHRSKGSLFHFRFDGSHLGFEVRAQAFIIQPGKLERIAQPARKSTP